MQIRRCVGIAGFFTDARIARINMFQQASQIPPTTSSMCCVTVWACFQWAGVSNAAGKLRTCANPWTRPFHANAEAMADHDELHPVFSHNVFGLARRLANTTDDFQRVDPKTCRPYCCMFGAHAVFSCLNVPTHVCQLKCDDGTICTEVLSARQSPIAHTRTSTGDTHGVINMACGLTLNNTCI